MGHYWYVLSYLTRDQYECILQRYFKIIFSPLHYLCKSSDRQFATAGIFQGLYTKAS